MDCDRTSKHSEELLVCPLCKGQLDNSKESWTCSSCDSSYPVVAGVPDLRTNQLTWLDFDTDRDRSLRTEEAVLARGIETALYEVFRKSRHFDHDKSSYRVKQVLAGIEKCEESISDWLKAPSPDSPLVEIGCGPGQLLAAAARSGQQTIGLDASLEWLVVAKHLISANGGEPMLAAAVAENLPFRDHSISNVASLDVIEHVADPQGLVNEIIRVLASKGTFEITTPNRYSFSPEPHVGVWGVGFLPVKLQARWVRFASGSEYSFTRLLSVSESRRLFSEFEKDSLDLKIIFPRISLKEIETFTPKKAGLARIYNLLIDKPPIRALAPYFGAYYRISGKTNE